MFDEKAFEKIICKHCALAGEVGCLLKDEDFVCPTLKRIEEKAIKLSDNKIEVIISEFNHLVHTTSDSKIIRRVYLEIVEDFERLSK